MQKKVETILKEIATKNNIPFDVVKAVYESQSMCTRKMMGVGEKGLIDTYLNVRWMNFGSWIVKPGRLTIIHEHGLKKNSNKNL